jgi:hypothetical protein
MTRGLPVRPDLFFLFRAGIDAYIHVKTTDCQSLEAHQDRDGINPPRGFDTIVHLRLLFAT